MKLKCGISPKRIRLQNPQLYRRRGSLFVKNFNRKEIKDDNYLRACILYIHLNPVHHGFAESASEWKWLTHQTFPTDHPRMLKLLFDNEASYHFALQSRQFQNDNFQYPENELQ